MNAIYQKDKGFGYETDDGAVKEAQDNLDQVLSDQAFQAEKDRLENERQEKLNALDAEKTLWEEYQKLWEDSTTTYEREQQKLIALEILCKNRAWHYVLRIYAERGKPFAVVQTASLKPPDTRSIRAQAAQAFDCAAL